MIFNKNNYIKRSIDKLVEEYLENCGAICIEGPKWCGKTWTSAYHSKSFFYVGNPDNNFSNRLLAIEKPSLVLKGDKPRMIDEWQEAPGLWDATRAEVDTLNKNGCFILTGSSTPKTKGILHSGTGRIISLRMSTMTLSETNDSTKLISLKEMFAGNFKELFIGEISLGNLAYFIVRGGFPKNISNKNPLIIPKAYVNDIIRGNLSDPLDEYKYNQNTIKLILKSLARNECTTSSIQLIVKDISKNDGETISKDTVRRYLDSLDRIFVLNNQEPFSPGVRSSLRIKQSEKRHFFDTSIPCAILNITPEKLINDLPTMGLFFESLVEHDLFVYCQSMNAKLYHYQNYDNDEIDAVIELENGDWGAFEIKLGASKIDEAAKNLNYVCDKIISSGQRGPILKCVISGLSNAAYTRSDGVIVIPFTSLTE